MGGKGSKPTTAASVGAPPTAATSSTANDNDNDDLNAVSPVTGKPYNQLVSDCIARYTKEDWGVAPESVPDDEKDPDELVLQTWASCKAKPNPLKLYRSDVEEKARRTALAWRKRISFIELDCGDDSFFVSNTYKTIGVADGVGGWRDEGYDPSSFSNALMKHAKHFCETHRRILDPEVVLNEAFGRLKDHDNIVGSSTATCASLVNVQGSKGELDVANLGNSGVIVVRNREVVSRAHEKNHGFNVPFQLAIVPQRFRHDCYKDSVSDCVREKFEVEEGDVVVMGTDGLFENRFPTQIAEQAGWVGKTTKNVYDNVPLIGRVLTMAFGPDQRVEFSDPYRVTQRLVQEAFHSATTKSGGGDTPWSLALRDFDVHHEGGKVDDITVLVARVTTRAKAERTALW